MLTRKLLKSKKGISPILATLLLIVIAVAAIVITYAWVTTYMGTTTQQAGFLPYKANVAFLTDTITIDVGNSGTSSGQIISVYLGTSASATTSQTTEPAMPITVNPSSIASFEIAYEWVSGTTYYFRVVPASGAALEFQAAAP